MIKECWCGATDWRDFNAEYQECGACHTLVFAESFAAEDFVVKDDESDFYGKNYWMKHQQESFGYTDFETRIRADLTERNLYWLKALLHFKTPPGKVLELGCAHGSFVALLRQAGFEASGLEMSPWIVEKASRTFDIPILQGPIEEHDIPDGSLDAILLMDVIEHLPDPSKTMAHCLQKLKPEGLLLIQTPEFRKGMEYNVLVQEDGDFLEQLKPGEHLYLFSRESLTTFFKSLGAPDIEFLPALYEKYDMFCAVSRHPLTPATEKKVNAALEMETRRRIVRALLDLDTDRETLLNRLKTSEADRAERLVQLQISEQDRDARFEQIKELTHQLGASEQDRDARFKQIQELTNQLEASEADRAARFKQIQELTNQLEASEADRAARFDQIQSLTQMVHDTNTDLENRSRELREIKSDLQKVYARRWMGWFLRHSASPEIDRLRGFLKEERPQMPRHIAIDLTPVLPGGTNGGAKVFAIELIQGLVQLYSECRLTVLVSQETREELSFLETATLSLLVPVGDKALSTPIASSRSLFARIKRRLLRVRNSSPEPKLRERGVELLFCPFTDPTFAEPGLPIVSTIHDLQYKTYPEFFSGADVAHRDAVFLRAVEKSTLLAAVSDYARDSAIRHGHIPHQRIKTIYHRLARRIAGDEDLGALERYGLEAGSYLIYPANFWRHKNHEVLLTAFGLAVREGLDPKIKLVLTGAPCDRQAWLIEAAHRMGLRERIVFPGYVSNAELGALIKNACGVVFPSLYEGFGIPVIEAMGLGVPVACSHLTSLPEVAGNAALLFDPRLPEEISQSMVQLATDAALRSQLMERGHARAALFSEAQQMAREHMDLFKAAIAAHVPRYQVQGNYADGWLGPTLWVQTEATAAPKTIEFEFSTRCWLPTSSIQIQLNVDGKPQKTYQLLQGKTQTIEVSLNRSAQIIEWQLGEGHVPSELGLGSDQRRLTLMLDACKLRAEGSPTLDLLALGTP